MVFSNCEYVNSTVYGGTFYYRDNKTFSHKHDQGSDSALDHVIYTEGATISSEETDRHTASGYAWNVAITNSARDSYHPVKFILTLVPCVANEERTVTVYFKKTHATDVDAKLLCRGGQINGVTSDVEDTKTDDTHWEQLSISFTPTEPWASHPARPVWFRRQ